MIMETGVENRIEGKVQQCGCIALPEALQAAFNLGPGATFSIEAAADGSHLRLIPQKASEALPQRGSDVYKPGAACPV